VGHAALVPLQLSAVSHTPAALRQMVPLGSKLFAGHAVEVPLQTSAASQVPADARQTVPAEAGRSDGQSREEPVHSSAASHAAALARQTVVAGWKASSGHRGPLPEHFSARSHEPVLARHTVVAALNVSAGHVAEVPLQNSATSHEPSEPRHWILLGRKVQLVEQHAPPSHCSPLSTVPFPHCATLQVPLTHLRPAAQYGVTVVLMPPMQHVVMTSHLPPRDGETLIVEQSGTPAPHEGALEQYPDLQVPLAHAVPSFTGADEHEPDVPGQKSFVHSLESAVQAVP
jgi:hypothetical protein